MPIEINQLFNTHWSRQPRRKYKRYHFEVEHGKRLREELFQTILKAKRIDK